VAARAAVRNHARYDLLFPCRSIQEALNTLLVAVTNGEGFIKITGEVGTARPCSAGNSSPRSIRDGISAYVPIRASHRARFNLAVAEELGIPVDRAWTSITCSRRSRARCSTSRASASAWCCAWTKARRCRLETLEALRLLTNLETEKRKLLQVVLFGQPELDRKLSSPSIRQLLQRITFQHHMGALEEREVGAYVTHRLAGRRLHRAADPLPKRPARAASREPRCPPHHQRADAQGAPSRLRRKGAGPVSESTFVWRPPIRRRPAPLAHGGGDGTAPRTGSA